MDDKEKEDMVLTFKEIFKSLLILTKSMENVIKRVENVETVVMQIAKIQGTDGKIVHKN